MVVINFSLILNSQTKRIGYRTKSHWLEIKGAWQPWLLKAKDGKLYIRLLTLYKSVEFPLSFSRIFVISVKS